MRLVSWNIRDLTGDVQAVQAVLRLVAPDVVCLQEAPRRPGSALRIAALARATGLRHIAGGRGTGGTALLVAPQVAVDEVRPLALPVAHWYTRTRGAVIARLRASSRASTTPGSVEGLALACVHLPLHPADRLDHAHRVRAELMDRAVGADTIVVAGDFNEPPGSPAWQAFSQLVSDPAPDAAATFPARSPGGRIDAVLVGGSLPVSDYGDGGVPERLVHRASDHWPVVVDLGSR